MIRRDGPSAASSDGQLNILTRKSFRGRMLLRWLSRRSALFSLRSVTAAVGSQSKAGGVSRPRRSDRCQRAFRASSDSSWRWMGGDVHGVPCTCRAAHRRRRHTCRLRRSTRWQLKIGARRRPGSEIPTVRAIPAAGVRPAELHQFEHRHSAALARTISADASTGPFSIATRQARRQRLPSGPYRLFRPSGFCLIQRRPTQPFGALSRDYHTG